MNFQINMANRFSYSLNIQITSKPVAHVANTFTEPAAQNCFKSKLLTALFYTVQLRPAT